MNNEVAADDEAVFVVSRPLNEYLDELENRRRYLIGELGGIDAQLIRHGRLKRPTLEARRR